MRIFFILLLYSTCVPARWTITATHIDPANYYGITVANGIYDNYQRGRGSNIPKTFNHMNRNPDVDGRRIGAGISDDLQQQLNMQHTELVTTFSTGCR